jgi:hypothetical protein
LKLWILEGHTKLVGASPWSPWCDKAFGFVVRAETEDRARQIAAENCGDEKKAAWLNPIFSSCKELLLEGEEEMILIDFAAA